MHPATSYSSFPPFTPYQQDVQLVSPLVVEEIAHFKWVGQRVDLILFRSKVRFSVNTVDHTDAAASLV
jgi:hypothetical protein